MKFRLGFSKKLLLLVMLAVMMLVAGMAYVVNIAIEGSHRQLLAELRRVMNADARSLSLQLASGYSDRLDYRLAHIQAIAEGGSRALSAHLENGGQLDEVGLQVMVRLLRRDDLVRTVFYCDLKAGQCMDWLTDEAKPATQRIEDHLVAVRHLLPQMRQPGSSRWSEIHRMLFAGGAWGVQALAPVFRKGTLNGFVGASIALDRLNASMERQAGINGTFSLLLDDRQRLIAASETALLHWAATPDSLVRTMSISSNPALRRAIAEARIDATSTNYAEIGGVGRIVAQRVIPRLGWTLVVVTPTDQVTRAVQQMDAVSAAAQQQVEQALIFSSAGMVLLIGVFCHLQLRRMIRPVRSLVDASADLSAGRYEKRLPVPSDDEFRPLVTAFNQMAAALQATFRDLVGANRQQYEANQQLQLSLQESTRLNQTLQQEIGMREKAERALSQSELRLQSILSHSPEPIFVKDIRGHYLVVNPAFEALAGATAGEIVGKTDLEIFPPFIAMQLQRNDAKVIAENCGMEFEENYGQMNRPHVFLSSRFLLLDPQQRPYALGCIAIDITQRKQAEAELRQTKEHLDQIVESRTASLRQLNSNLALEIEERHQALEQLKESEQRYQMLLDNVWDGVAIIRNGELFYANPALQKLLGAERPEQIMCKPFIHFIAPALHEAVEQSYRRQLAGEPVASVFDSRLLTIHGEEIDVEISTGVASYHGVTVAVAVIRDSRIRKHAERELQRVNEELLRLSTTDALTGLYNRRYLMDTMATEFARAKRYWMPLSVMMIDVDHFKSVNDRYGHQTGDLALQHLASLLRERTRGSDIAARYGGEEIIVLLPQTAMPQALSLAEILRSMVASQPLIAADGSEIQLTVSVGVASFPEIPVDNIERLLQLADKALYLAKAGGRNRVVPAARPGSEPPDPVAAAI